MTSGPPPLPPGEGSPSDAPDTPAPSPGHAEPDGPPPLHPSGKNAGDAPDSGDDLPLEPPGRCPCPACGADLVFSPTATALECPYCGTTKAIAVSADLVDEHDFQAALEHLAQHADQRLDEIEQQGTCQACGATVMVAGNIESDECPYCGGHLQLDPRPAEGMIRPHAVLPFGLDERNARASFRRWLASLWFAPSDLKALHRTTRLHGLYLPFWTYDAFTITHYTGERGDDYWTTEWRTTYKDGKMERESVRVRKTRWSHAAGRVDHRFDDVLVIGSHSLPTRFVDQLQPWDLKNLVPFDAHYLRGFQGERYTVSLPEGFDRARELMEITIRRLCRRDIGGDHQRLRSVRTQHLAITFKHLLLPVWHSYYRYKDRVYHIVINARTGEVQGERPISWWKVALTVLGVLAVIGTIAGIVALIGAR